MNTNAIVIDSWTQRQYVSFAVIINGIWLMSGWFTPGSFVFCLFCVCFFSSFTFFSLFYYNSCSFLISLFYWFFASFFCIFLFLAQKHTFNVTTNANFPQRANKWFPMHFIQNNINVKMYFFLLWIQLRQIWRHSIQFHCLHSNDTYIKRSVYKRIFQIDSIAFHFHYEINKKNAVVPFAHTDHQYPNIFVSIRKNSDKENTHTK